MLLHLFHRCYVQMVKAVEIICYGRWLAAVLVRDIARRIPGKRKDRYSWRKTANLHRAFPGKKD